MFNWTEKEQCKDHILQLKHTNFFFLCNVTE